MHSTTQQHNYVISLLTAKERRNHIIQEFGKQNIPFEFFDAITPDLIEEKAKEFGIDISSSPLTKGEIACALSHIALWHLAKEKELDYICIFEDDIYLGENAKCFLTEAYINNDVDIIKFETFSLDKQPKWQKKEKHFLNRRFYTLTHRHVGMAGYLITKKGVRFILQELSKNKFIVPIDDILFDQLLQNKEYKVWQIIPAICIQDFVLNKTTKFESSLEKERDKRTANTPKKKRNLIRKIYRELTRPLIQLKEKILYHYIPFK